MFQKNSLQIKICGITNYPDAVMAIDAGADILGFNFYSKSSRYISPTDAQVITRRLPPIVKLAGIFVNADALEVEKVARQVPLDILQFHGEENCEYLAHFDAWLTIKAFRPSSISDLESISPYKEHVDYFLFDSYSKDAAGGTGKSIDNEIATKLLEQDLLADSFLSGGLTPENVAERVAKFLPYGVDVASGVEKSPGMKDTAKVREFIKNARIS